MNEAEAAMRATLRLGLESGGGDMTVVVGVEVEVEVAVGEGERVMVSC